MKVTVKRGKSIAVTALDPNSVTQERLVEVLARYPAVSAHLVSDTDTWFEGRHRGKLRLVSTNEAALKRAKAALTTAECDSTEPT